MGKAQIPTDQNNIEIRLDCRNQHQQFTHKRDQNLFYNNNIHCYSHFPSFPAPLASRQTESVETAGVKELSRFPRFVPPCFENRLKSVHTSLFYVGRRPQEPRWNTITRSLNYGTTGTDRSILQFAHLLTAAFKHYSCLNLAAPNKIRHQHEGQLLVSQWPILNFLQFEVIANNKYAARYKSRWHNSVENTFARIGV